MAEIEVETPASGGWPLLVQSVLLAAAPQIGVGRAAELGIALEAGAASARAAGAEWLLVNAVLEPTELALSIEAADADKWPAPGWEGSLPARLLKSVAEGVDPSHPSRLAFRFRM